MPEHRKPSSAIIQDILNKEITDEYISTSSNCSEIVDRTDFFLIAKDKVRY
ncbi:MAG: hypothetical protein NC087_00750 [Anaeroplasma bactoclasticum]|nr:hypothetical protein [Anaeroplasma bactoclasticum]MCM1556040.1 hypothetical protein [Anaeroplasma bactoclasticum]